MAEKKDRIVFHGKGCDYEFSIPLLPPGSAERERLVQICEAEWDSVNSWAIKHNIECVKKWGTADE